MTSRFSEMRSEVLPSAVNLSQRTPLAFGDKVLIGALLLVSLIDVLWLSQSQSIQIDLKFFWVLAPIGSGLLLLWGFYHFFRVEPRISFTLLTALQLLFFTYSCGTLSYLLMGFDLPWRDDAFAAIDRSLGFGWVGYMGFIKDHPWLFITMALLYQSTIPQLGFLVLFLGFTGSRRALMDLLALIIVGGVVTVVIGALLPALGAYHYFHIADDRWAKYAAIVAATHDGRPMVIDLTRLEGLIMFPSYHTLLSAAFIVVGWPNRYLRYPLFLANIILILGVPVFGSHYLTDVIGGLATAVATIVSWRYFVGRRSE